MLHNSRGRDFPGRGNADRGYLFVLFQGNYSLSLLRKFIE